MIPLAQPTQHQHISGGYLFVVCVLLHVVSVKAGGVHYSPNMLAVIVKHFSIENAVALLSGLGSIATAVVLIQHYRLRNKLLRKELKDQEDQEQASREEERDNA